MSFENYLFNQLERAAKKFVKEDSSEQDSVTLDVPLFIRLLELAREDIKSDAELHHVVERVLAIKDQGTLSMDHYDQIVHDQTPSLPEPAGNDDLASLKKLAGL